MPPMAQVIRIVTPPAVKPPLIPLVVITQGLPQGQGTPPVASSAYFVKRRGGVWVVARWGDIFGVFTKRRGARSLARRLNRLRRDSLVNGVPIHKCDIG